MNRFYTLMLIPEKNKDVKSFRIPVLFFKSLSVFAVIISVLFFILIYDYYKIYQQIYENKHLSLENKQLKEQIQLFQMKMNTLTNDIQRIHTFEKKLRIITGLEDQDKRSPVVPADDEKSKGTDQGLIPDQSNYETKFDTDIKAALNFSNMKTQKEYIELKTLYDKKIAFNFGLSNTYDFAKEWSQLTQKSLALSEIYSAFDYKFSKIKTIISNLEVNIHNLDEFLLDKESFLKSTPTLLPTNGWITSYFGRRFSPYSGKLKMHEGIDVGAPYGHPIYAPADGVVTYSGKKAGFGKFVQIDHGYGVETLYAHSQSLHVTNGQEIKRGTLLARVGSTGHSTGPHLHYEVRINGIAVDPLYFVLD